jgi:beta-lactamase class A
MHATPFRRRALRTSAIAVLVAAVVAACGPAASLTPGPTPSATAATPSATPAASPAEVAIPATPAGDRLRWVVDTLNGDVAGLAEDDVADVFNEAFLAQVPPAQLVPALRQLAGGAPFTVTSYSGTGDTQATATITGQDVALVVQIAVDADAPHRIAGLLFQPADAAAPTPVPVGSWDDVDAALAALAPRASLFVGEVSDGTCTPIHGLDADAPLAIGSTFKLYVLGALAQAVADGDATWDESLAIRDDLKTLPSGTMQDEAAGTTFPLREFATRMISISDNTAADHLLVRVGRESVEAMLPRMGMADPAANVPFLAAGDLFVLKATRFADLATRYLAADAAARRVLLDGEVAAASVTLADFEDWTAPRAIDTLEWFGSTSDLCRAMAWLAAAGDSGEAGAPVLDVLAVNPALQLDAATWPYVGFKGGSEPGVLQLTWLLERTDGRRFVLSMTLNDPASAEDDVAAAVALAQGAVELLAKE